MDLLPLFFSSFPIKRKDPCEVISSRRKDYDSCVRTFDDRDFSSRCKRDHGISSSTVSSPRRYRCRTEMYHTSFLDLKGPRSLPNLLSWSLSLIPTPKVVPPMSHFSGESRSLHSSRSCLNLSPTTVILNYWSTRKPVS